MSEAKHQQTSSPDFLSRTTSRRTALQTLGGLAGLLFTGQLLTGCGSEDNPGAPAAQTEGDPLVLMVPGFMSRFEVAFDAYGEAVINDTLQAAVRTVPVIGDRIAAALPHIAIPASAGGAQTFDSLKAHYSGLGVDFVEIPASSGFNTQQSVAANGVAIANYLGGLTNKRVTILTHSKGGLDTLEALLENPDLWGTTVTGWVALQAPFHGSPIADNVPSALAGHLLTAFGGDQQALLDLRTSIRGPYMADRAADIAALAGAIPVSSCHSSFVTDAGATFANAAEQLADAVLNASMLQDIAAIVAANLLDPAQATTEAVALIRERALALVGGIVGDLPMFGPTNLAMTEANDGLVPVASTLLSGAASVAMSPAADHASPVKDAAPFRNFWTTSHRNEVTADLVGQVRGKARAAV